MPFPLPTAPEIALPRLCERCQNFGGCPHYDTLAALQVCETARFRFGMIYGLDVSPRGGA